MVARPFSLRVHHLSGQTGSSIPKTRMWLGGSFSCLWHARAVSSVLLFVVKSKKWARRRDALVSSQLKRQDMRHKNLPHSAAAPLKRLRWYPCGRHPGNTAVCVYRVCLVLFCAFAGCAFGGRFYSLEDTWHPDLGEPFGVMHCVQCYCEPVSVCNAKGGQTL